MGLGMRLPTTWEWQLAAGGPNGQAYPWGDIDRPGCRPATFHGRTLPGALPVNHAPAGCASAFNVSDLVGHVWEYTSAFEDLHSRSVVLKGGSNYQAIGPPPNGRWYFPQAHNLTQHNRMALMDESYERAGTVGFRCVRDVEGSAGFAACGGPAANHARCVRLTAPYLND